MATLNNPQTYARFAGFNYLLIFALAIFANFFVLSAIRGASDPGAFAANEAGVRIAIAAFLGVLICDVFISWAFYLIFQKTDANISLLSAMFRLTYTIAQIGVVLNLAYGVLLVSEPGAIGQLLSIDKSSWPHFFLLRHDTGFTLTLTFFGLHLLLLGYLIIRSDYLPSLIGVLVIIAGAGYIVDAINYLFDLNYGGIPNASLFLVILPGAFGRGLADALALDPRTKQTKMAGSLNGRIQEIVCAIGARFLCVDMSI